MDEMRRDETNSLIASDKVEGTAVYASDGDKIGTIRHFMVGKRDGQVEYAVMSCGGFLGMGEEYRPVPWDALTYDTDQGGYVVNVGKDKISGSPAYDRGNEPTFDQDYGTTVRSYYGTTY